MNLNGGEGEMYVYLNNTFVATSIIGFLVSWLYVMPMSLSWGTAFLIVFSLMFIASMISMVKSQIYTNKLDERAVLELKKK
ncbi:MAG: hypothetical protein ACMXX7_00800 [Candidatus Woesearchaeota archaeon]